MPGYAPSHVTRFGACSRLDWYGEAHGRVRSRTLNTWINTGVTPAAVYADVGLLILPTVCGCAGLSSRQLVAFTRRVSCRITDGR